MNPRACYLRITKRVLLIASSASNVPDVRRVYPPRAHNRAAAAGQCSHTIHRAPMYPVRIELQSKATAEAVANATAAAARR